MSVRVSYYRSEAGRDSVRGERERASRWSIRIGRTRVKAGLTRETPHNLEAEQATLGAMFLSAEAVEGALAMLQPEDFYRPAHARIFSAMSDLNSRSVPVDHLSVADRLESTGELEAAGGKTYLLDVTGVVPIAANWQRYADIVKRMSMLRQLIAAGTAIVALGYDAPDDLDQVVGDAEKMIFDVTNKRVSSNFKYINDLLKISFKELEELAERKEHITGVPTGFKELDKLLAGLHPGDLCILAARPSVGKTALALNIGGQRGEGTERQSPIFSLEMGAEQLVQRVLCSEARINLQDVRTGYVKDADWYAIHTAMGKLAQPRLLGRRHPVDLDPRGARQGAPAAARQAQGPHHRRLPPAHAAAGPPLGEPPDRDRRDHREGSRSSAKELGVPVLALSQLSRAVEQRAGKRPAALRPARVRRHRAGRRRGHVHRPQHRPACR